MPYRPKDIYRGRRKFKVPLNIFLFVLALLLVGAVSLFYFLQQYAVYDDEGAHLELPFGKEKEEQVPEEDPAAVTPEPTFEPVPVEVIWEDPDFEDVDMGGWEDLKPIHGRFIAISDVMSGNLTSAVASVTDGDYYNAAVFQMKDSSGQLAWSSVAPTAVSYGTSGTADVSEAIDALHAARKTAVAQISCFTDTLLAQRNWPVALMKDGMTYRDDSGRYWVDPYNQTVRTYITDLAKELASMGFDEIVLADLEHPVTDSETGFTYTTELRTSPDPVVAVCQMGRRVVQALEGTGTAVSVRLNDTSLRQGLGSRTGQDIPIFWRLFARLYCPTSPEVLANDMELAVDKMNDGDADVRFVPVMGLVPEVGDSYVITS